MGETLALNDRLRAYRKVLREHPELDVDERASLFSLAVWPDDNERRRVLTWEHLQRCRDRDCRLCQEGELAA